MSERYYWNRENFSEESLRETAELSGDEAHHLIRVMRQKCGDAVILFDGCGGEYQAEIIDIRKDRVTLRLLESRLAETESKHRVTIAASLPKGDRQKWMLEKLTELGCYRFIPLSSERGVAKCSADVTERLRRQVLEASKQCGRSRLMLVENEKNIAQCVADFFDEHENSKETTQSENVQHAAYIAHPLSDGNFHQQRLSDLLQDSTNHLPQNILVMIGPEGGFTDTEITQAIKQNIIPLDLGTRILRIETAAIMITAVLTQLTIKNEE